LAIHGIYNLLVILPRHRYTLYMKNSRQNMPYCYQWLHAGFILPGFWQKRVIWP